MSPTPPKNWPPGLQYLVKLRYSKSVSPEILLNNVHEQLPVVKLHPGLAQSIKITVIDNRAHPACGERGLFAWRRLLPDTFVVLYLGLVHGTEDANEKSDYDLSLDRELKVGVDASTMGNEARFINDYRGIRGEGPNACSKDCLIDVGGGKFERGIGVYVLPAGKKGQMAKGIEKGEEIVVSYGKGFWSHRQADPAG